MSLCVFTLSNKSYIYLHLHNQNLLNFRKEQAISQKRRVYLHVILCHFLTVNNL